jgi:aspartyl-tRNA(Asn)/glutamyl-tRNA(Gln) amidotransferase subunit A
MVDLPSTIAEAGDWLRTKRISSVELTREMLARAHAAQESVSAFLAFTDDTALEAAQQADRELASGDGRGPLHGIPLAVKDLLATRDAPTTASSRVLDPAWGQRDDATVVRKLRDAGAVLLGKLALHEYAIGWPDASTGIPFARNPWDLSRAPGGSSSGTGAAVAAGLILGGLGSDTGGSIRGPAAYCGISGLKPTFGLVSKEGCVPLGYSLDHVGPMARTMRDCALLLQTLAGYDAADLCSANAPVPEYAGALNGSLQGVRIGVPRAYFFDAPELNSEVRSAVEQAIADMQRAGASVRDVVLPHASIARSAQRVIMLGEAYAYHEGDLQSRPEVYGRWTRLQLVSGALYTAADYVQAQRVRTLIKAEVEDAMRDVDVLVMPTAIGTAPTFEGYDPDALLKAPSLMAMWNLTGQPAASICCGFSDAGLPIGMQLVGGAFDDSMVLRVGDAYQQVTDWHTRTPQQVVTA